MATNKHAASPQQRRGGCDAAVQKGGGGGSATGGSTRRCRRYAAVSRVRVSAGGIHRTRRSACYMNLTLTLYIVHELLYGN